MNLWNCLLNTGVAYAAQLLATLHRTVERKVSPDEHNEGTNVVPFWKINTKSREGNCKLWDKQREEKQLKVCSDSGFCWEHIEKVVFPRERHNSGLVTMAEWLNWLTPVHVYMGMIGSLILHPCNKFCYLESVIVGFKYCTSKHSWQMSLLFTFSYTD